MSDHSVESRSPNSRVCAVGKGVVEVVDVDVVVGASVGISQGSVVVVLVLVVGSGNGVNVSFQKSEEKRVGSREKTFGGGYRPRKRP
jgi:uncharacterized spore protein YtfJ